MKFLTYNIRYDNPHDGQNRWDFRKSALVAQIRELEPDIFGVQEALAHQMNFLKEQLSDYDFVGFGRDDGALQGEFVSIFYKKKAFTIHQSGLFWLSETPDFPSKSWDAALPRICTFVLFEYQALGKKFRVFNTHLDHQGIEARKNAARLILSKTESLNADHLPFSLMGDFNAFPEDTPIQIINTKLSDSKFLNPALNAGSEGTFNGFQSINPKERIDYIFLSPKNFDLKKYTVLNEIPNGQFLSDHFPVMIEVNFL